MLEQLPCLLSAGHFLKLSVHSRSVPGSLSPCRTEEVLPLTHSWDRIRQLATLGAPMSSSCSSRDLISGHPEALLSLGVSKHLSGAASPKLNTRWSGELPLGPENHRNKGGHSTASQIHAGGEMLPPGLWSASCWLSVITPHVCLSVEIVPCLPAFKLISGPVSVSSYTMGQGCSVNTILQCMFTTFSSRKNKCLIFW